MKRFQEVAGYNAAKKKMFNLKGSELPIMSILMNDIQEVKVVDHTGRLYFLRVLSKRPELDQSSDNTISVENLACSLEDIKETFVMLNDEQRDIVMHIYYLYKNKLNTSEDSPKIILQGPAGAGKSTIISFIEKLVTWEENKTSVSQENMKVLKCAYTGKAATNIEGLTLHSVLSLPLNKYMTRSMSKRTNCLKQEMLKDCVFFICDEISMVGEQTMKTVNSRLQQIFENKKLYGGRFVLLVGDLFQIDPIKEKPLYPNSDLWLCCKFYELTKVIRQRDQNFIDALHNFRDSRMRKEDMNLLRSRVMSNVDQVPDSVIHLFFLNDDVDAYNNKIIDKSKEREVIVNVFEDSDDWRPTNLRLKIGIRYMITVNVDVSDGLANGTTGILRDFHEVKGTVDVVWMEFHSIAVGKKAKLRYRQNHKLKPGFENWVPIGQSKMIVTSKSDSNKNRKISNMFPLRAAEALTVHKSQGQTYHDGVCIHFTNNPKDSLRTNKTLQYVALTRVTRIENLYILGNLDFSDKATMSIIRKRDEMNRLRNTEKLKLAFETFEDKTGDVIIFLNTGKTYNEHYEFITSDKWYSNASLLIFTETNTIESDKIEIPNFEIAFRSDGETVERSGSGIIIYKKRNKSLEVVSLFCDEEDRIVSSLLLFEKSFYIIVSVKTDIMTDDVIEPTIPYFSKIVQQQKCIVFVGNFNTTLTAFVKKENFHENLSCNTKLDGQNDMVFTRNLRIRDDQLGFYQYIPCPHKPIYVKLPLNSMVIEDANDFKFEDEKSGSTCQQTFIKEEMETEAVILLS